METLAISYEELRRLVVMDEVEKGKVSLLKGAGSLGVGYLPAKRVRQASERAGCGAGA